MTTTVHLQLTITETHITLARSDPDQVLASVLLDALRSEPNVRASWRDLCGAAIEAAALQATKNPALESSRPVQGLPHL
jgi:hypothetical protein